MCEGISQQEGKPKQNFPTIKRKNFPRFRSIWIISKHLSFGFSDKAAFWLFNVAKHKATRPTFDIE